jgi:hypothetical protein
MTIYTTCVYHWALCNLMNNACKLAIIETAIFIAHVNHLRLITYKKGAQCE